MGKKEKRLVKVAKFRIIKPAGDMSWDELGETLREVRYRVFRLANMAVSEAYMGFHAWRSGKTAEFKVRKQGELSRMLREMLSQEGRSTEELERYSPTGALPDTVVGSLYQNKIRAATMGTKWSEVVRGKVSLPTYRLGMAIPIRCNKMTQRRLERVESGAVEVDLMVCRKPYPRVVLGTKNIGAGQEAILERLLENEDQSEQGYRQRCFEVKEDGRTGKWFLYVTYDFAGRSEAGKEEIIVGVDVGYSCPLYAAVNNGKARIGWRRLGPMGNAIKKLQRQVQSRRRSIQRGGANLVSKETARSGHGRKRILLPTEALDGKIERAYSTMNHQLSSAVVEFAKSQSAGVIQMEKLDGLKEELTGTYIGANWRYYQLQQYVEYKGHESGIKVKKINPRYTSRRCSKCGYINEGFTREYRNRQRREGKKARYECVNPKCKDKCNKEPLDADYNAAKNISEVDIEKKIRVQCRKQGIKVKDI